MSNTYRGILESIQNTNQSLNEAVDVDTIIGDAISDIDDVSYSVDVLNVKAEDAMDAADCQILVQDIDRIIKALQRISTNLKRAK